MPGLINMNVVYGKHAGTGGYTCSRGSDTGPGPGSTNDTEKSVSFQPRQDASEGSKTSVVRMGAPPLVRQRCCPFDPVQFGGQV
jgi:hypothetical protein